MDIESEIRILLRERLRLDPAVVETCQSDTPLLGKGIGLDSVAALNLASGLEEKFDVTVEDDELTPGLFASLGALAAYVQGKRAAAEKG